MTTRNWVLIGLAITAAAGVAALFTTERGRKVKGDLADRVGDWTKQLRKFTESNGDGAALVEKAERAAAKQLKHLP